MTEAVEATGIEQEGTTKIGMDWRDTLIKVAPEYVSQWDEFKNSDSPEKFFDQLKNHRSMIGQSVRIPGQDAGAEQLNEFYNKIQTKVPGLMKTPDPDSDDDVRNALSKLGLPEKPDDYNINQDLGIDPETLGAYRAMAHEAGLTKKQFERFLGSVGKKQAESAESTKSARESDIAGLRGEWGQAFDQRAAICARVAEKTGAPKGLVEAIKNGEADSQSLRWLFDLSKQLGGGEGMNFSNGQEPVPTPVDIQGQIDDMMGNGNHPYWNSTHPGHKAAVDKMLTLRRQLMAKAG